MKEVVNAFVPVCVRMLPRSACRRAALDAGPGAQGDGDVIGDGLAPQHTHADAFRGHADIDRQGSKSRTPDHVVFAGDSAAGGLALAFAQSLPTLDLPKPVKLVFSLPGSTSRWPTQPSPTSNGTTGGSPQPVLASPAGPGPAPPISTTRR